MSSDDRQRPHDDLGGLSTDFREELDAELGQRPEAPDIEAMFARAAQLGAADDYDPNPADDLVDLDAIEAALSERNRTALSPFVNAYRAEIDHQLGADTHKSRKRPRVWTPLRATFAAGLSAAALVLLFARVGPLAEVNQGDSTRDHHAAQDRAERPTSQEAEYLRPPPKKTKRRQPSAALPEPISEVAPVPDPVPDPVPPPEPAPPQKRRSSVEERLKELDKTAQRRWRRGDLQGATKAFMKMTKIGGKRSAVQLAYSELATLAKLQGKDPGPHWTAYLKRFPRGRYAVDAKAGLCRRTPMSTRETCWDEYRQAFPKGKHAPPKR